MCLLICLVSDWHVYVKSISALCLILAPDCTVNFIVCDNNFLLLESNAIKLNWILIYQRTDLGKAWHKNLLDNIFRFNE